MSPVSSGLYTCLNSMPEGVYVLATPLRHVSASLSKALGIASSFPTCGLLQRDALRDMESAVVGMRFAVPLEPSAFLRLPHDSRKPTIPFMVQYTVAVNMDQRSISVFCQTRLARFPMRFAIIHVFTLVHVRHAEATMGSTG